MSCLFNRRYTLAIFAALTLLISTDVVAVDQVPRALADHGKLSQKRVRHYRPKEFIDGKRTGFDCPIALTDPFFGYLSDSAYLVNEKLPFILGCYHVNEKLFIGAPVQFDESKKQWVKRVENAVPFRGPDFTPDEVKKLDKAIRVYNLESVNATGYAFTEDEQTGEESGRSRVLHYCLVRAQKALCGQGEMGYVQDIRRHPQNDLTNYTLRILRSIEFIDEPDVPALAASAAASAP